MDGIRVGLVCLTSAALAGCPPDGLVGPPDGAVGPVVAGRQLCDGGVVQALTDAGDQALCLVPEVACLASSDIKSVTNCHYAPSASPANACCDARPSGCAPADCDCLLNQGPWIDHVLAEDAGTTLAGYDGPRRKCSYRVSCIPAADGGVAVLACTPA